MEGLHLLTLNRHVLPRGVVFRTDVRAILHWDAVGSTDPEPAKPSAAVHRKPGTGFQDPGNRFCGLEVPTRSHDFRPYVKVRHGEEHVCQGTCCHVPKRMC